MHSEMHITQTLFLFLSVDTYVYMHVHTRVSCTDTYIRVGGKYA